jgi:predicted RNase H-like HicB family nuclease
VDTKVLTYRTVIKKDGKNYHGFVPSLPGCNTDGRTIEETKKNLKEAIQGHVASLVELGWEVPVDDSVESFESVDLSKFKKVKIAYA